ncbi:plasmid mobilization protein [Stenotrophomonas maltophilia]
MLNAEAELIEKWLDVQRQAAEDSLDLLRTVPGIEVEPSFQEAYEVLVCRSAGEYTGKPFLFEDTEALARSVMRYACMIARPHRARMAYLMARAKLSEHEDDPTSPEATRARQTCQRKKNLVSKRILGMQERRTNYARTSMLNACRSLNKALGIKGPMDVAIGRSMPPEFSSEEGGNWSLKFKPRMPRL